MLKMVDREQELFEKLRRIEALFAGAKTDGEREAAARARERIRDRLEEVAQSDPPEEFRFSPQNMWSQRLLIALMRRYNIRPYRYKGQRRTTVMARVPRRFVDETLVPEFMELDKTLEAYLSEITSRVIAECIEADRSDIEVRQEGGSLSESSSTS